MKNRGASSIVHYLDDFFTCDTDLDQCRKNLDIMSSACIDTGFSLQPSKIVPPSAKKVRHLHHYVRLNKAAVLDIQWWITYLPSCNGISVIHKNVWTSCNELQLWSDASNFGFGAYFVGE